MHQVFNKNGVSEFNPLGEKFNPTDHEAMFKFPDPEQVSLFS